MHTDMIYDWNTVLKASLPHNVEVCDETLRDGIQSPSVVDPTIEQKLELISLMDSLGITIADIGLPGAGSRAYNDVLHIAQFVRDKKLTIKINCAARTHSADILPIAQIQDRVGIPITAYCFLGTSPIRQLVEDWSVEKLKKITEDAISFAIKHNLSVAFVTEDTTRSDPKTLEILFKHAINLGIERLVLCDTVGHATPDGVKSLVNFTKNIIKDSNTNVKIDWHGHNDRGLAVANAIFAAQYGCHRIHGTALGIGERVGNTSIDQLIVNLKLLESYHHDVSRLAEYVEKAAAYCQIPLPYNYPVFGHDAFRTATGVHAAAVVKAQKMGQDFLSDTIYSGVPAFWFSKQQTIEIGPMSGVSNVKHWLLKNNIEPNEVLIKDMLSFAKTQNKVLSQEELKTLVAQFAQT